MSLDSAKAFLKKVNKDKAYSEFKFTADELHQAWKEFKELSDSELDAVAGGGSNNVCSTTGPHDNKC
jgi:bacteriocin-like protein